MMNIAAESPPFAMVRSQGPLIFPIKISNERADTENNQPSCENASDDCQSEAIARPRIVS